MSRRAVDLNCDLGESAEEEARDLRLLRLASSANVACGGHAGDVETMRRVVAEAARLGVAIGAHPSYPDREGFGRRELELEREVLEDAVAFQVATLAAVARRAGAALTHVKAHGALYNRAARDPAVAEAIGRGVARVDPGLRLVGLAGSRALAIWKGLGFAVASEAFADRGYAADGTLLRRGTPGALVTDPPAAAAHALALVESARPDTICVHSDTDGSPEILAAVRKALEGVGFAIAPLSRGGG